MSEKRVRSALLWASVVIVAVVVLCPAAISTSRERARRITCSGNLGSTGLGFKMYAGDHDNAYPDRLVDAGRYVANLPELFVCPSSGNETGSFETVDEWTDYVYISGLGETSSPDTVLMYCPAKNHHGDGGNLLFQDGHVEWFNSEKHCGEDETSFEDMIRTIREQGKP